MDYKNETQYVETLQTQTSHGEGHLEKRFSKLNMPGMAFAILDAWIALASTLAIVLPSRGPVAFVYGFIICVLWNLCLAASMGKMASVWPTAGGQYHWAYAICAPSWKDSMSFPLGWKNITVFTSFTNLTGYSDGTAWILGLLQSALSLIGFDAVRHMTEEMPRPTRDAPQARLMCIAIGGTIGILLIISLLFCIPNLDLILSTTTGQPLVELIYQSTGSTAAAIILASGLTGCFINGTIGSVASGSRLLWGMGRDGGAPFSQWLAHIHTRCNIHINAVLACALFNILFGLRYLGPAIAFNAYISSCTIFLTAPTRYPSCYS